jgi:excisionase family DNA binding protein
MQSKKEMIGIRDAARRLNYSLKYVYDLIYEGKLPSKKVGRKWRIPLSAVEERLKDRGE